MARHNKNYYNDAEFQYRLGVYRSNLQFIEEHNKLNKGFSVAMNQFGDLTNTEFGRLFLGIKKTVKPAKADIVAKSGLPSSWDWSQQGAVTPIKNQGQCGSCWSLSATGSMEGAWFLKKGNLVSLSEQQLVDCSSRFGNQGCNGGLMDDAFKYIISNGGLDTEADYAYTARDGKCDATKQAKKVASITGFTDVPANNEAALEDAVASKGPVSVAINVVSDFQFYSSGIYNGACSSSASALNHGVVVVGFENSGSAYWIVRNSWGTSWGEKGYIRMTKGKNICGIADAASYPVV